MDCAFPYSDIIVVVRPVLVVFQKYLAVPVIDCSYRQPSLIIYMGVGIKRRPVISMYHELSYEYPKSDYQRRGKRYAHQSSSLKLFHDLPPAFTAMLALSLVSAAFRNASKAHDTVMLVPPLETNGNVTPVKGSRSTHPKTLSIV